MVRRVEVSFVVEAQVTTNIEQESHQASPYKIVLIDKDAFYRKYIEAFPNTPLLWTTGAARACDALWDRLLGNYPNTEKSGEHPHVHYLTEESCNIILKHLHQFKESGLDYQNLPDGFLMVRNPNDVGGRDVLHYNEHLKANATYDNPLAISLTAASECQTPLQATLTFEAPKQAWYEYFIALANHELPTPCTQEQLDKAFIHFANKAEACGLSFYEVAFNSPYAANPITYLGRLETILFQRHLKPEDRENQWKALMALPVAQSHEAIRALTDHMHGKTPCGFLVPQMGFDAADVTKNEYFSEKYIGHHTVKAGEAIAGGRDNLRQMYPWQNVPTKAKALQMFWRYIAFQPKRNSIGFYEKAILCIPEGVATEKLLCLLAAATTGANHAAKNEAQETQELEIWKKTCTLVDTIETCSLTIQLFFGNAQGRLQTEFLYHLTRLDNQPNMMFLGLIAKHCYEFIRDITVFHALGGESPLKPLAELSDKLAICVYLHGTNFYQGARFYLNEAGLWSLPNMCIKRYTELAYDISYLPICQERNSFRDTLIALLSTFHITTVAQVEHIAHHIIPSRQSLEFLTEIFSHATTPLNCEALKVIFSGLKLAEEVYCDELTLLDIFEEKCAEYFEEGFFQTQKQLLEDAANGLNEHQIGLLKVYPFEQDDRARIVKIESAIVRQKPMLSDANLIRLNDQFMSLTDILMPSELSEFLERFASLRDSMPADDAPVSKLLDKIITRKSLAGFNLVFLRNTFEKISNASLVQRINKYIELETHITQQIWPINPILLQETLATLVLRQPEDLLESESADHALKETIDKLAAVAKLHPHAQEQVMALMNHHAATRGSGLSFVTRLQDLADILVPGEDEAALDNMGVFYALTTHYKANTSAFCALLDLLKPLPPETQRFFFIFVSRLLSNGQPVDALEQLVNLCKDDAEKMARLATYASKPPYASIEQLHHWLSLEKNACETEYNTFCLSPFGERKTEYMFNFKQYLRQRNQFEGLPEDFFTPNLGRVLDQALKANREKSPEVLLETIETLRKKPSLTQDDLLVLLPVVIEILARTAHQQDSNNPSGLCSQELNTTQVMAAFAMLSTGQSFDKVINQVDTGEGKGRLMAILCACEVLQNKTVDMNTSNLALAERDWLTYLAFYTALRIPTGLINMNTPPALYRKKGVNVSDSATLILLRNKSDIERTTENYLDKNRNERCLMLDEEDKFVHDKSSHAHNYAAKSKLLSEFTWIYPLLVQYIQSMQAQSETSEELVIDDTLQDGFLKYIPLHDSDKMHQASLASLHEKNPKQLKLWLQSAQAATQSVLGEDYLVTPDADNALIPVKNKDGITCYTRQVLVVDNGRPMEGSQFSDGVHQCICAIENQKAGKEAFLILPENQTQRSSYADTYIESYEKVYGVSGSTRAKGPMASPEINYQGWQYMITPREKPLARVDKRVLAAKDDAQHIAFLKQDILEACRNGQSYLLICKSDKESRRILDLLEQDAALQAAVTHWQYVHGLNSSQEEKDAVAKAGTKGYLTVASTGMFSRGVDIRAENLRVCASFVPTLEDEVQIKGRTGRFGKPGDYRMVINLNDSACPIDGRTHNIERRVIEKQHALAVAASFEEKTAALYAQFLEEVHQHFIQHFDAVIANTPLEKMNVLEQWQTLLESLQKDWELERHEIKQALEHRDLTAFQGLFSTFTEKWCHTMQETFSITLNTACTPERSEKYFKSVQAHQSFFATEARQHRIKVKWSYDKADDGQATIYQMPFAKLIATLTGQRRIFADVIAWWEGRGVLFPDLMAVLNGERLPFANLIAFVQLVWELIVSCFVQEEVVETDDLSPEPPPEGSPEVAADEVENGVGMTELTTQSLTA